MSPRDAQGPSVDEREVPLGTDADEQAEAASVTDDAAESADDAALDDAGLPHEEESGRRRRAHRKASLAHRLYNGEAGLDVVGKSTLIYRITAVVVLICLASMIFRGFNFGIEFAGGNSFRVPGTSAELSAVQNAATDAGADVASAQVVGGDSILVRTGQLSNAEERDVVAAVADAANVDPSEVTQQAVSAAWGQDVTKQALIALVVFLVAVVLFLAVRFQPKMALAAIVALIHDLIITAG